MVQRIGWGISCLFACLLVLTNCTPTETTTNSCTTNADCKEGERCVRQTCKAYVKPNNPPVAAISGKSQRLRLDRTAEFDGSKSADPDGDEITYEWDFQKRPEGSKASITDADKAKASLKADVPGLYVLQLVVKDKEGLASKAVTTEVEFYGKDENGDPIASAGPDTIGCVGEKVELDGTTSSDPDGDQLTYKWVFVSKPTDSAAALDDETADKPSFTADKAGKYVLELVVNDGLEDSPKDTISIQVLSDCDLQPKLTSMTPNEAYVDDKVKVKLVGEAFSEQVVVLFNNTAIPESEVQFISATEIEVQLSLSGLIAKDYEVKVKNPNQKLSNALMFKVKDLPLPELKKLLPATGVSGAKMEIKAEGTGFISTSEVLFNLVPLPTKITNDKELTFTLDLSQTLPGVYKVKVSNPGGRNSKELEFKVVEAGPAPILNVLNPPSGVAGQKFAFSVHGVGFAPGAVIVFDGKEIPSTRIRRDEIQANGGLDLTNIKEGNYDVWVKNPDGKISNKEKFLVEGQDPTPVLDRILPFFLYLDDSTNKLAVYGLKFRQGLKLKIGQTEISGADILFKSNSYFEAKVDTTKGTWKEGDYDTVVINPSGKISNKFKMTVTYRIPSISNVTPSGWTTGCDVDVEVSGTNFVPLSQVKIGNLTFTPSSTTNKLTYVNDTLLRFKLTKGALSSGTHTVQVTNATKAKSTTVNFVMTSQSSVPKPEIREIRPSAGRADTKVSIIMYYNGSNRFWQGAVVYLDGKKQKTTCSSSGNYCYNLGAELDLTGLKPGRHDLTVKNPCGKDSAKFPFYVADAPGTYLTHISPTFARPGEKKKFVLNGVNFTANSKIYWGGTAIATTYKSATELLTTNDVDFTGAKAGDIVDVYVDNGNGKKTNTVKFSILDTAAKLYITSVATKEFERGKVHNGLQISGAGFTANSEIYFNGQKITAKYTSPFQIVADGLDFRNLKIGAYELYVKDGTSVSNKVWLYGKANQEPLMSYIRPNFVYKGVSSVTLYAYGRYFCQLISATSSTCQSGSYKLTILDPNGQDVSSRFSVTRAYGRAGWTYDGYIYGKLNTQGLANGDYKVYFELPTGERSIAAVLQIKNPPPPYIDRIQPAGIKKGSSQQVRIYGTHLIHASGTKVLIGLQTFSSTSGSSSGGTYLYSTINTANIPEGTHKLAVQNPDGQISNYVSFTVYPKTLAPTIRYTSPDVAYSTYSGTLTIYGENFTKSDWLFINGKKVSNPTYYNSSSYSYFRISGWKPPASATGDYQIYIQSASGAKSNVFSLGNAGSDPFIRYLSPDYRYNTSPTYTRSVYIYGFGFDATAQILIDGQPFAPTYRGTSYIRRTHTFNGYKNYSVQVKNGNGKLSNKAIFSLIPSTGMRVTSSSPSSVLAGADKYVSGRAYVYGANFTKTAQIYLNGKALKTRYSATNRLYVDEALDFTTASKAELWHWEVRDGTKKSNTRYLRVETGKSRLNRPRFTSVEPFAVSKNQTGVVIQASSSYLYSQHEPYFEAVVDGNGITKKYPISYVSGRWTFTIDTTGWKAGVYNVRARNKATGEMSGGCGLVVLP